MLASYTTNTIARPAVTREGLEPSRHGGHGLLRTACLPFHHLAIHHQWTVEGVEPSSAGCKPTVFPLDDTPSFQGSGPGGDRTHIPLFKRQVLRRLSYKAFLQCVGQELNLHSVGRGWVTATWARQCPADTSGQYPGWDLNPCSPR